MTESISYLPQSLLALGIILLIVDITLLGFSTFIYTFFAGSLVISGALMWMGVLPATATVAVASNVLLTAGLAALLWKPLQRIQNQQTTTDINNDFAQLQFRLEEDVDDRGLTSYQYSGIRWRLKSEQPIAAGTLVIVLKSEVGALWVGPK